MIYMAKEAPFSSNLFGKDYENISATSWWKTGRRLGFPGDLVNVALPLVAAASSSAGRTGEAIFDSGIHVWNSEGSTWC